ncbi:MAG TPA: RNA polymerase sigma factor [Myxococcota bacterium]|nr:RNA polymerase sigma factor [Myxococcota bacterium]
MNDPAWIDAALAAARPQAVAALLRYFRDLDVAEEAFQDACLRALSRWNENGPPRDPAAWLILVGRNCALDALRRKAKHEVLVPDAAEDEVDPGADETELVERLDTSHFRDDVLRLLFVCAHPSLAPTQQVALALRVVSGLSVKEIASAFLVSESAMEQRITRAKRAVRDAEVPFESPDARERSDRLEAVAAMIYLLFNEGYSASGGEQHVRVSLCDEAVRLARLLLRLFVAEPEIQGLLALLLLQHARAAARVNAAGEAVLLDQQDRGLWDQEAIAEGLALVDKLLRADTIGPYGLQAAIAAVHVRARGPEATDWATIDRLYAALETAQPSPVVTLNHAVAVSKLRGPAEALALIEPLAERLDGYFHFHGVRGALLGQLGRTDDARDAFGRAISLARTPAEAANIRTHLDGLKSS